MPESRRFITFTAFVEGWALYAERLAVELGWYKVDPYGRLGQLQFESIRAARLATDTGIHLYRWSFDEAVNFYQQNTGASFGASQGAVIRFILYPGQANAYMIGMKKIQALRERFNTAKGEQYQLKDFHDLVLGGGSMPLDILDLKVSRHISQ